MVRVSVLNDCLVSHYSVVGNSVLILLVEQHCQRRASWQAPGPDSPFLEGHRQVP